MQLPLPFAYYYPGWETIKTAAVLLAAVVAAEYKTILYAAALNGGANTKVDHRK